MNPHDRSSGEDRAWNHYKRTGVVLPTYQGTIADRIAGLEQERHETESSSTEDETRLRV